MNPVLALDAAQVADIEGTACTAGLLVIVCVLALRAAGPGALAAVRGSVAGAGVGLAGGVAVLATAGSLWFSEVANFPPCRLCWFQRIPMYSLALILVLAAFRRDAGIRPYALLLGSVGLSISAWHVYVETFPSRGGGGCDPADPCTIRWVEGLGFWTIPRMAALSFALILTLLLLDRPTLEER